MRTNQSNPIGSFQMLSSNRNLDTSSKMSQRLGSRLKSVMPQLKGKKSQIYLTIKVHNSFEISRGKLIQTIKTKLQQQQNEQNLQLINYIKWQSFADTKQLLKQQYIDNQLYYIIVPQKYLSWAETFTKQQRQESQGKKRIHVLGILKDTVYEQKLKLKSKKRLDKVPDYIHYYNLSHNEQLCSDQIIQLINLHLQQKLKNENDHIKNWALSNKYATKESKRRTIHIYYDQQDKDRFEHIYWKYNQKCKSSWLQIHCYKSFYDIVKSIKNREMLNNKQAQKVDQLYSRIKQSRSNMEPTSMKSFAFGSVKSLNGIQASQLLPVSLNSEAKLNADDVNVIITRSDFQQIDKLKAFVKAQKFKNWDLIQINTESPQFYTRMQKIFEAGKQMQKQYNEQKQDKIIKSRNLYIIASANDQNTQQIFNQQDNVFHNMQLFLYKDVTQFAILLRQGVKSKDNFSIAIIPGGINTFSSQYQSQRQTFLRQYRNNQTIQNFLFISTSRNQHLSIISDQLQKSSRLNISVSQSQLPSNADGYLENILVQRDNFFHPFKGLKGINVYILVRNDKVHLMQGLRQYISQSRRLQLATYIDKEYLTKQLQTIHIKDSAILVTDDSCMRQAQQVLINFDQTFIMNITDRNHLKEEVKVFAWGDTQTIYGFLRLVPQLDNQCESQIYMQNPDKLSLVRSNRIMPKKVPFMAANTIVVRLPADLTSQQSRKMQVRLKKHFNQQIKIQYYKEPSDIRLKLKQLQPLTFNILQQAHLKYMKTLAKREKQQKREQYILYTKNPSQHKQLIQKPQFQRFKFLSNSWEDIQKYIIGTYDLYVEKLVTETIYQDQFIHLFLDTYNGPMVDTVKREINYDKLKAANNVRFHFKKDIKNVVLMGARNHKYFYILDQNSNLSQSQKVINHQLLQQAKSLDKSKNIQTIVLSTNRNLVRLDHAKSVLSDQKACAQYINQIKVLKVQTSNGCPYILLTKQNSSWYYFLDKYSQLTKRFNFRSINSTDLKKTIEQIKSQDPTEDIWVMTKDQKEYNQVSKVVDKIEGKPVGVLCHGDRQIKNQRHKKVLFAHQDRKEVQKFILNPFRRSYYQFFPSSVSNNKVILAPLNTKNGPYKQIPIDQNQIDNWKKILNARIIYCANYTDLMKIRNDNPDHTIYTILDAQTNKQYSNQLDQHAYIKRIVLNLSQSYSPRTLRNNYILPNNQIYHGAYPSQLSQYLRYLRYNILTPQTSLVTKYPAQLTEIYTLQSEEEVKDPLMKYVMAKNSSLVSYRTFTSNKANQAIDRAYDYSYNTIFVGDDNIGQIITERNKISNRKIKFINSKKHFNSPNNSNQNIKTSQSNPNNYQLQTNQQDEIKMYLYNLPQNRFDRAKDFTGKFKVYCNNQSKNKLYQNIFDYLRKVSLRNGAVEINAYNDPKTIVNTVKQPSFVLIQAAQQQFYQNLLKNNQDVQYLIVSQNDLDKNYTSYGNKYFINKDNVEYYHFFNNLGQVYKVSHQPLPLVLDKGIQNVLRNIKNMSSQPLVDEKLFKLTLNPPFRHISLDDTIPIEPISFNMNILDRNPPNLQNIPQLNPATSTPALGLKWLNLIRESKINKEKQFIKISAPALDFAPIATSMTQYKQSQPDLTFPTFVVAPKCPAPQVKRFHLAVLYLQSQEFKQFGQMLKSNLEPEQFTVKLISFRNQRELQQYAKGNGSRLNEFDKIIIFLRPQFIKYDNILKTMKSKLSPRMQYFLFDDSYHVQSHQLQANHLRPYRIRKVALPYQNPSLPIQWSQVGQFKIFIPYNNHHYDHLQGNNVQIIEYGSKEEVENYLHLHGVFNVVVTDRSNYHLLKDLPKRSLRMQLIVQDTADLFEDQFLFYRFPSYSIYYGQNGADYLRRNLPKPIIQKTKATRIVYYFPQDRLAAFNYKDHEKCQVGNYAELYERLLCFSSAQYSNWLLKTSPVGQLLALKQKVYLQDQQYMKDYKNNFMSLGYRHKVQQSVASNVKSSIKSSVKSSLKAPQFSQLPQHIYTSAKQLASLLESEVTPCVILINGSNNKYLPIKHKYSNKHKFFIIVNDQQRWIDYKGYLLDVERIQLRRKQDLFLNLFNQQVFDQFNDFQYYYLSNKADVDRKFNIYFRTKQDLQQIYHNNPNLLMVVFVQKSDRKHIPQILLTQQAYFRVKIIYLSSQFIDDQSQLYIKFNEIDPVIIHINRIENAGRRDYIVFREIDGDKKRHQVIMQRQLQGLDNKIFNSMEDVQIIADQLKGQYRKIYVICYPTQQTQIQRIFERFSIKNKQYSQEGVEFFHIDQVSTILMGASNIRSTHGVSNIRANPTSSRIRVQKSLSPSSKIHQNYKVESNRLQIDDIRKTQYQETEQQQYIYSNERNAGDLGNKTHIGNMTNMINIVNMDNQGNSAYTGNLANTRIQQLMKSKNFTLSINQKLKNKMAIGNVYVKNIQYFSDPRDFSKMDPTTPRLIISNQKYSQLQKACDKQMQSIIVFVKTRQNQSQIPSKKSRLPNTILVSQQQLPMLMQKLQGSSQSSQSSQISPQYQKIRIFYEQSLPLQQKRKLLATSYKNSKILPTKYISLEDLTQHMKQNNTLTMLMMEQPFGLQDKVGKEKFRIVKKRKYRMILPDRAQLAIEQLDVIFQEDQTDNQYTVKIHHMTNDQIDNYLNLLQQKPYQRQALLDQSKSKLSVKNMDYTEEDQITKLNVHSNIRPEDLKLLSDDQILKIKQRLDGNLIVLVIQHSKKEQVKPITQKYNILVQSYTNALNLENDLRDRKDSVTIALISKKMIDKIIPLKKKYKQVSFILENDTGQEELLQIYKPYIAGQIRKMSELQKLIGDLYILNERIRINQHNIKVSSRFENKHRPSISIVDYSNNQRFSTALNNQKSKKAYLFYKQPQNSHIKSKLSSEIGDLISFIPYKNVVSLKSTMEKYNSYSTIVIANGHEIQEIQDYIARKKENVFLIRFNPPEDLRDNPRVKRLFSTYRPNDLEDYLQTQLMKIGNISNYERIDSKYRSPPQQNIQQKKYTKKYQPNAFGTTPRFPGDFVPPKSMKQTYSNRLLKSQSRSKM